jgi:hypothetical protein
MGLVGLYIIDYGEYKFLHVPPLTFYHKTAHGIKQ